MITKSIVVFGVSFSVGAVLGVMKKSNDADGW